MHLGKRQMQVIGRLQRGEPVRRIGAFGTSKVPIPPTEEEMDLWDEDEIAEFEEEVAETEERCAEAGFFTKDTLDRLEIRGFIVAGKYWGQYNLTPLGKKVEVKEPA